MDKSLQESFTEVENLLEQLDENKDNLEKSIEIYQQANDIYKDLKNKLKSYKAKVEIISSDE